MFLLYPYLFGHSHFNFKDIPFMSVWIICTYFIMKIVNNYHKDNKIFNSDLIYLSILTAVFKSSFKYIDIFTIFNFHHLFNKSQKEII